MLPNISNFSLNLTAHVQPANGGIIRAFKAHYCHLFIQCALDCYNQGVASTNIYTINQLQAMHLVDLAWKAVKQDTIQHCWEKTSILSDITASPSSDDTSFNPVSNLE